MKKEIPKEEKRNEFWYCILIVAGLILLLLGDQIALRFIQKNPNSNNSIFGSSEKIGKYQIDFLEELSLNQVIEKINHKEKFLVLSSRQSCETCKIYLPDLKETLEMYNIKAYYINKDNVTLESTEYKEFLMLHEDIKLHFSYTPFLMYFKDGNFTESIVGRVAKNKIEDFIIKNKMVN